MAVRDTHEEDGGRHARGMSRSAPTKRKLEKARRDGKVLKSRMLTCALGAAIPLAAYLHLAVLPNLAKSGILLEYILLRASTEPLFLTQIFGGYLRSFGVFAGALAVGACAAEIAQVRLHWSSAQVAPRIDRLSPGSGAKRIAAALAGSWSTALCFALAGSIIICATWQMLPLAVNWLISGVAPPIESIAMRFLWWCSVALLAGGICEYCISRRRHLRQLEMKPEELKEEYREDNGDPLIRAMQRAEHRALLQLLSERVRRSRVVVVERS